ncbi:hypothetical protein [Actinoplanes derwentensis]|uniref:Uncharacterized protein n=1 Tax=Actinoplanes derwentensis TaxID=113562 RepID=A0A1H2CV02_9ACTN|nr:hypothetical protein [Actinoplanes derwentensis]GID81850.1 hypothetical protein Ade03nite_07740 [Actinoplanes derwentensis]SDT73846.1 hypothetical protein SAMN04489716_6798 [Actinoplanes derwentensis]
MSFDDSPRSGRGLSEHLKRLDAGDHSPPSALDIDGIVRGGRRRRRRRTVAQVAAGIVMLAGISGVALLNPGQRDVPVLPPATSAPSPVPALPPVNASDRALVYQQSGETVTLTRNGTAVATVALADATYTASSAHVVLTITAQQPLVVDTGRFIVYDDNGGENGVATAQTTRFEPGVRELTLDFSTRARPAAIGWVPQDGEGGAGVWERP